MKNHKQKSALIRCISVAEDDGALLVIPASEIAQLLRDATEAK